MINGRWKAIATLSDYAPKGDSASLAKIGNKAFTPTHIEDSDYTQGDEITKGIKITTEETFTVEGRDYKKLHTTRVAVLSKLGSNPLKEDINSGKVKMSMKCVKAKTQAGKDFFDLVDA